LLVEWTKNSKLRTLNSLLVKWTKNSEPRTLDSLLVKRTKNSELRTKDSISNPFQREFSVGKNSPRLAFKLVQDFIFTAEMADN